MDDNKTQKYKQAPIDLNLPSLPLYRIQNRRSNKLETWESEDEEIMLVFTKGRPSIEAQGMLIYLFSKIERKDKGELEIENHSPDFTLSEVCKYLEIKNTSRNRKKIKDDCDKLNSTVLKYVKRFIVTRDDGEKAKYKTVEFVQPFKFFLFDDETKDEQLGLWKNQIIFHELIKSNLKNKVYRLVNTAKAREIKNPTASRIFFILSVHNHSRDKQWKIGLLKLAKEIPIQTETIRNTRQVIKEAMDYLKQQNAIYSYNINSRDVINIRFEAENYQEAKNLFLSGRNYLSTI